MLPTLTTRRASAAIFNLQGKYESIKTGNYCCLSKPRDLMCRMEKTGLSPNDPNSYSKPEEAEVTAIKLVLDVDFKHKVLHGKADLMVERRKDDATHLMLDSKELKISKVLDLSTGQSLEFTISAPYKTFGSKLEVRLPNTKENKMELQFLYETSPSSTALQWLDPAQTAGGTHPYMFSHCEAIHCRSMVPCQDTPSVKCTYTAEITAPAELTVLMSAKRVGEPVVASHGKKLHKFEQPIPIPIYLIAIAVGCLESRKIGPRSHVWSEKEMVEKAAYEFGETEKMLSTAEEICGEYVWGIYDILVLPPSFPFGGMENPCLTFMTPTLLAGDRSLANFVTAHEISHSWTGNLVTNRNFEHFWLNEGFTMFVERKIIGRMNGEKARHFSAIGGLKDLKDAIAAYEENSPLTCLVPDLRDVDPDDSFSTVPYEKGHTLLFYLEQLTGQEKFDAFLKAYVEKYKYKSLDTNDFRKFLYEYFPNNAALKSVDWDAWLHKPGMPPVIPRYDTSLTDACTKLKDQWVQWDEGSPSPFMQEDLKNMSAPQVCEFIAELLEEKPLSLTKLQAMEKTYKFNSYINSEIRFRWLRLCIRGRWKEQLEKALEFVTEQGRMKFVRPIYRDLYAWEEVRDKAITTFKANRPSMMYVSAYTVAKDLHLEK